VDDPSGRDSDRGYIKGNSIALLRNLDRGMGIDPPPNDWLGRFSPNEKVRNSGLSNINYTDCDYDPGVLDVLEQYIVRVGEGGRNEAL